MMGDAHTILYLFLMAESVVFIFNLARIPLELLICVIGYASMMIGSLIWGYYQDMYAGGGYELVAVYALLGVFAVLCTVYFYLKDVSDMLEWKIIQFRKKNEREYEKELAERAGR
jgi:hypothetical protein